MIYKKDLAWLVGYPTGDGWTHVGAAEAVPVDSTRLHRAKRALNELRLRFAREGKRLLGSFDVWEELLARLKPTDHAGAFVDGDFWECSAFDTHARRRARELASCHPLLAPVVNAVSWLLCTRAHRSDDVLNWLDANASALATPFRLRSPETALATVVSLAETGLRLGFESTQAATAILGRDAAYDMGMFDGGKYVRTILNAAGGNLAQSVHPARPRESALDLVTDFVALALECPRQGRRYAELLAACDVPRALDRWKRWWDRVDALHRRVDIEIDKLNWPMSRKRRRSLAQQFLAPVYGGLAYERDSVPGALRVRDVRPALKQLAATPEAARVARLAAHLQCGSFPGAPAGWCVLCAQRSEDPHFHRWASALETLFVAGAAPTCWARMARKAAAGEWVADEPADQAVTEAAKHRGRAERAVRLVVELIPGINACREPVIRICCEVAGYDLSPTQMKELVGAVAPKSPDFTNDEKQALLTAYQLVGADADRLPPLLETLAALSDAHGLKAESIKRHLDALGLPAPLQVRVLIERTALVRETVGTLERARQHRAAVGLAPGSHVRPEGPGGLEDALDLVARWCIEPQATADRVIDRKARKRELVERELTILEQRIAGGHAASERMRKRAENLRKRLAGGDRLDERVLARLRRDLELRAASEWLERHGAAARTALVNAISGAVAVEAAWLFQEPARSTVPHLDELPRGMRRVAYRLLRARAGAPPWDLRDEPSNARFIATMEARGLRMAPWLDGIGSVTIDDGGSGIAIELERDPLEVLIMGKPFDTCLSPDSFNFHAAVANATDVNKRVVYARDDQGRICARRLVALTDEGRVLTYRHYATRISDAVEQAVAAFIRQLVDDMGARHGLNGDVSNLVACDWYDDGPHGLNEEFDIERLLDDLEDSPDDVGRLRERLIAAYGHHGPDYSTVQQLVECKRVVDYPLFATALVEFADDWTWRTGGADLVGPLEQAGHSDLARALFLEQLVRDVRRVRDCGELDRTEDFLLRHAPGELLAAVMRCGPRGLPRVENLDCGACAVLAGRALEALRRPAQARRAYQQGERCGHRGIARDARQRLTALEQGGS